MPSYKGTKDPNQYWKVMSKLNTNPGLDSSLWVFCSIPSSLVMFWCDIWWCVTLCTVSFPKGCPWSDSAPWTDPQMHYCIFPGSWGIICPVRAGTVGAPHTPFLGCPWHDLKVSLSPGEGLVLSHCQAKLFNWNWTSLSWISPIYSSKPQQERFVGKGKCIFIAVAPPNPHRWDLIITQRLLTLSHVISTDRLLTTLPGVNYSQITDSICAAERASVQQLGGWINHWCLVSSYICL